MNNDLIKDFEKIKKYSNLISIGKRATVVYLYKYMTIDTAIKCLTNGTFMFSLPPTWKDPYESRFYNADYHNVEKNTFNRRLYACCLSQKKLSESAWKMYTDKPNEHCVKFSICIGQLRKSLNQFAKLHNAIMYEGKVNYAYNDSEINGLHLRSSKSYHSFFGNFGIKEYLNLMLIKRQLFDYEREIRFMIMGDSLDFADNHLFVEIPWSLCLSKISMRDYDPNDEKLIMEALEANCQACMKRFSLQYKPHVPIEIEEIYKPFKRIIVER